MRALFPALRAALLCAAALIVVLSPASAEADERPFHFQFSIGPGFALFTGDKPLTGIELALGGRIPNFGEPLNNSSIKGHHPGLGPLAGLGLGFSLWGFGGARFEFAAHGFDLSKEYRGGSGFIGGGVHIHPVEIAAHFWEGGPLKLRPEREWEITIPLTFGYTISGAGDVGNGFIRQGVGQEGSYVSTGIEAEYFFGDTFSLGLDLPFIFASYDEQLFTEYDEKSTNYFRIEARSATVIAPRLSFKFHFYSQPPQ